MSRATSASAFSSAALAWASVALRLKLRGLERLRIDDEEELPRLDESALGVVLLEEEPLDASPRVGVHVAWSVPAYSWKRDVLLRDGGDGHDRGRRSGGLGRPPQPAVDVAVRTTPSTQSLTSAMRAPMPGGFLEERPTPVKQTRARGPIAYGRVPRLPKRRSTAPQKKVTSREALYFNRREPIGVWAKPTENNYLGQRSLRSRLAAKLPPLLRGAVLSSPDVEDARSSRRLVVALVLGVVSIVCVPVNFVVWLGTAGDKLVPVATLGILQFVTGAASAGYALAYGFGRTTHGWGRAGAIAWLSSRASWVSVGRWESSSRGPFRAWAGWAARG